MEWLLTGVDGPRGAKLSAMETKKSLNDWAAKAVRKLLISALFSIAREWELRAWEAGR